MSQVDGIQQLYDAAIAEFGQIDIVVANAGMEKVNVPVAEVTEEDFDLLFRVNTKGPYFVTARSRPADRRQRPDHHISSNTTTVPQAGVGLYGTSKVATGYLARVLALELGPRGITVNTVVPGPDRRRGHLHRPGQRRVQEEPDRDGADRAAGHAAGRGGASRRSWPATTPH